MEKVSRINFLFAKSATFSALKRQRIAF